MPQLINGGAFIAALFSSTTCEFIKVRYDYDWTSAGSWIKTQVEFGMLSRETADKESEKCYWYTEQDFKAFFHTSFKVAVVANILSTLIGGLLFIYSLFLWCRIVTKSSIRFLCYVTIFCIIGEALTHLVFFSDLCMVNVCTELFDGSQDACVNSYCELGAGTYFSIVAIGLWAVSLIYTVQLLIRAEEQMEVQKLLRRKQLQQLQMQLHLQEDIEDGQNDSIIAVSSDDTEDTEKEGGLKEDQEQNQSVSNNTEGDKMRTRNNEEKVMDRSPFSLLKGGKMRSKMLLKTSKDGSDRTRVEL